MWSFHNAKTGLCFPSYERIAEAAGCARSTVAEAIKALEDAGILSWVNRIKRVAEASIDLFGRRGLDLAGLGRLAALGFRDSPSFSPIVFVRSRQNNLDERTPRSSNEAPRRNSSRELDSRIQSRWRDGEIALRVGAFEDERMIVTA